MNLKRKPNPAETNALIERLSKPVITVTLQFDLRNGAIGLDVLGGQPTPAEVRQLLLVASEQLIAQPQPQAQQLPLPVAEETPADEPSA